MTHAEAADPIENDVVREIEMAKEGNMLTDENRMAMGQALSLSNSYGEDPTDADLYEPCVVETRETLDDYKATHGSPETIETAVGILYRWNGIQKRKGLRRGSLYLMDFGNARGVYFDGEVD